MRKTSPEFLSISWVYMIKKLLVHWPLGIFVIGYVAFSSFVARDFGVAWDEQEIYARSAFLLNYLLGRYDYTLYLKDTYGLFYNHLYGLALVIINAKGTFGIYHLLNMLFALPMYLCAYAVVYKHYKNVLYATLGIVFLLLTPGLFGHIPFNPKDGPFAVFFFTALSAIYLLSGMKNWKLKILVLGIVFGVAQSVRIIGFGLFLMYFMYELYQRQGNVGLKTVFEVSLETLIIFVIANFILIATWPYLGANYAAHLVEIFNSAKNYPWDGPVLFDGVSVPASKLPATYLPKLFLYTTPLFILLFFVMVFGKLKTIGENGMLFLAVLAVGLNTILYFLLKPTVYDGLRHYLFLLPLISLVAAFMFIEFVKAKKNLFQKTIIFLVLLNIVKVIIEMIILHPYEYIYFNEFVGGLPGAYGKYETEYMGISHKDAIVWLKNNEIDPNREYYIINCGHPFSGMYYLRDNMHWTDKIAEADYHVCYTRFNQHLLVAEDKTIYIIKRFGVPINFIRKL